MKRRYLPTPCPPQITQFPIWATRELQRVSATVNQDNILDQTHAAPDKPVDGMLVYADGSDWNPGSGEGIYAYYGAAWHKLG